MNGMTLKDARERLFGKRVWSARRGHGSFLTMEFGEPHLQLREPIKASADASPRVQRDLARRRVFIVGDWHLWIMYAHWSINTPSGQIASDDADSTRLVTVLEEIDGQILTDITDEPYRKGCVFRFDLGGAIAVWPAPDAHDDQWALHGSDGGILTRRTDGSFDFKS